jgi:hypothetical protein
MYLGDFKKNVTLRFYWNTYSIGAASITRATNGTITIYEEGGATQFTTGVTDTEDSAATGVHRVAIDTSNADYEAGKDYAVILTGAVIDGRTVNAVLAHFSIENRFDPSVPKINQAHSFNVYMVDSTDHVTPETGLTLTVEVSKSGAGYAAYTGSVTNVGSGTYRINAAAADMNDANPIFKATATGADAQLVEFRTRP